MTTLELLHTVFSFLPFTVCLFWLISFIMQLRRMDSAQRFFLAYLTTCVVLYLCHALFFTVGLPYELECTWTLCSLSVYPLFYGYICRLTSERIRPTKLWLYLLPGAMVALAKYILPDMGVDRVRVVLFGCQIAWVCYFGIRRLHEFDRKIQATYADTEGRETTSVHHLLLATIIVSILAGLANGIGKQVFGESLWLLIPISMAFSTMQFSLSYICYYRDFTIDQLTQDEKDAEENVEPTGQEEDCEDIGRKIEALMVEQHYFLKKDLKIGDVVREIGSNRTYVSNYINRTYLCSFSDYMNKLRIAHAQQLLLSATPNTKLAQIAEESGYASEQSFYRNFRKFAGMNPTEWVKKMKD